MVSRMPYYLCDPVVERMRQGFDITPIVVECYCVLLHLRLVALENGRGASRWEANMEGIGAWKNEWRQGELSQHFEGDTEEGDGPFLIARYGRSNAVDSLTGEAKLSMTLYSLGGDKLHELNRYAYCHVPLSDQATNLRALNPD
ncbi:hypothetical protein LINGRAHAP2_LOCUS18717 [Linum grandiflorum]